MPITVLCPNCHARFSVSEKFAGKQGPCPKCKAVITVPKLEEQVKVHEAQAEPGAVDKKGRPVLKPIAREEAKFSPILAGLVVIVAIGSFAGAFLLRSSVTAIDPAHPEIERHAPFLPTIGGLAVLTPLLVWAGYQFLRDVEKEPYQGTSLWLRVLVCAVIYAGLWGVYFLLFQSFGPFALPEERPESWAWLYLALPFAGAGTVAAWACFDLEWGDAFMHCCFFLIVTVLLRMAMGLSAV
ncbi:MAG TPA: hypothetical protein VFE24_08985 [Pirellulales bacterium]|jgi:hypothetical protein|nr:hypothetical protein [Pirellulales bacterium]